MLDDLATHGLNKGLAVHEGFDLVGDEFARTNVQRTEVDLVFVRLGNQRTQESVANQFLDPDFVTDRVEDILRRTDRSILESKRGGREPNDAQMGIDLLGIRQELLVHPFRVWGDEMAIVD